MSSIISEIQSRDIGIDVLKGIAIIAVVLYHIGGGQSYLGVDIFLVISGYFMIGGIRKRISNGSFKFFDYEVSRALRLWPLVLIFGAISLIAGYVLMLPDDYENLAESVVASNFFANNILAYITTGNYWDVVNIYKPLMHMWYVGILMQAYVLIGFLIKAVSIPLERKETAVDVATVVLSIGSFLLFLFTGSTASKFYLLPYRLFELTAGGMVAIYSSRLAFRISNSGIKIVKTASIVLLLGLLTIKIPFVPSDLALAAVVAITCVYLVMPQNGNKEPSAAAKAIARIGQASYSIFVSHQVIIAFAYYSYLPHVGSLTSYIILIVLVAFGSLITYIALEKPLNKLTGKFKWQSLAALITICLLTATIGFLVYLNAGVVRDVPELGISKDNITRGMHAAYCDVPYSWNMDFSDDDRCKVLVIGDSFGRDFANILNESELSPQLDISYFFSTNADRLGEIESRIEKADYVFYAKAGMDIDNWQDVASCVPHDKFYLVGPKNFGSSNGIVYSKRFNPDYLEYSVSIDIGFIAINEELAIIFGDHYVDMLAPVTNEDGTIRVFTESGRFISQDCRHLTRDGALFYSHVLNLGEVIKV